jgi:hypothetical protein
MSRNIVLALMGVAVLLAGCDGQSAGEFAKEHRSGLIGAGVGAGIGALAGAAVGRNTSSALIGAAVGGGIGYLLGNEQDKKRAETYDRSTTTALTGSQWRVQQLDTPNAPAYKEMYLSFEPNSQLVMTQVRPDGEVVKAAETYRVVDNKLVINRPAQGDQPGHVLNTDYAMKDGTLTINSPEFRATLQRADQLPAYAQTARAQR